MKITNAVVLEIKGLGHPPAFKNSKMLTRGRIITKPEFQRWMEKAIHALSSQLLAASQTTGVAISTDALLQSLIVFGPQFDDSRQWLGEESIRDEKCAKGDEGATITVELLQ